MRTGPPPATLRSALRDHTVRRELAWTAVHGTGGLVLAAAGLTMPVSALEDVTFPLWYRLLPAGASGPGLVGWPVRDLAGAVTVALAGAGWLVLAVVLGPGTARLQSRPVAVNVLLGAARRALTNAARHSGARGVVVTVGRERDQLLVVVQDDGTGGAAVRIVIAEDDALLREGLALLLRAEGLEVVATTDSPGSLLAAYVERYLEDTNRHR